MFLECDDNQGQFYHTENLQSFKQPDRGSSWHHLHLLEDSSEGGGHLWERPEWAALLHIWAGGKEQPQRPGYNLQLNYCEPTMLGWIERKHVHSKITKNKIRNNCYYLLKWLKRIFNHIFSPPAFVWTLYFAISLF